MFAYVQILFRRFLQAVCAVVRYWELDLRRLISTLIIGLGSVTLHATTLFWDGGTSNIPDPGNSSSAGGDGSWSTTLANWDNAAVHITWPTSGTDNDALFAGTPGIVNLTSPVTANDLSFDTSGYVVAGSGINNLTLNGNSPTITVSTGSAAMISAKLAGTNGFHKAGTGTLYLAGSQLYSGTTLIAAGKLQLTGSSSLTSLVMLGLGDTTLELNGNASIQGLATQDISVNPNAIVQNSQGVSATLTVNHTGDSAFSGILRDHPDQSIPNSLSLTRTGVGTLILANANSFSGSTTIAGGSSLAIGNDLALGIGTLALNTASGSLRSLDDNVRTIANPILLSTNFTFGSTTTGNLLFTGNVVMGSSNKSLTINNQQTELRGIISSGGSGTLTKLGPGSLVLSGANTYAGTTIVTTGSLSLTGVRTANAGGITVGGAATNATLNIADGMFLLTGDFSVGNNNATALGVVNQTGGDLTLTGNQLLIGRGTGASSGEYNLSGGSLSGTSSANRGIILGTNNSNKGTFNLSGTGIVLMPDSMLQIGRSDSTAIGTVATFNQSGGTAVFANLSIGGGNGVNNANTTSILNLTGGSFSTTTFSALSVGNTSSATITIGGTAFVTLPAFPTVRGTNSTATIIFDGGTISPTAASEDYLSGMTNAFVTANGARFHVEHGKNITISQLLENATSQAGTLYKSGIGTLTLAGTNTYTGPTTVSSGTLNIAGAITSNVQVLAAGTLTGTGTITGNVQGSGTVAPGNSIGTLHILGDFEITGMQQFEIAKDATNHPFPVYASDRLNIFGNLTYVGTLQVLIPAQEVATLAAGDQWNLFDSTLPSTGMFSNTFGTSGDGIFLPMLDDGLLWQFDYDAGILSIESVPEPFSITCLTVFVLILTLGKKLRQHSKHLNYFDRFV